MTKAGWFVLIIIFLLVPGFILFTRQRQDQTDITTGPTLIPTNSMMLKEDSGFEVSTGQVNYFENVKGFYAKPAASGNYPGVVMIHEWWGLNENIKDMAEKLAGEGYRVLA